MCSLYNNIILTLSNIYIYIYIYIYICLNGIKCNLTVSGHSFFVLSGSLYDNNIV